MGHISKKATFSLARLDRSIPCCICLFFGDDELLTLLKPFNRQAFYFLGKCTQFIFTTDIHTHV